MALKDQPSIITLLHEDHEVVSGLFAQVDELTAEGSERSERLRWLYREIRTQLKLHAYGEQQVVYPMLREQENFVDLADDFESDHEAVSAMLAELDALDPETNFEEWDEVFSQLAAMVEEHVEDEEDELFPELREQCSLEKQSELAEQFVRAKESLRSQLQDAA